jgi:tetratricopeptide (TPR) repeat protein
LAEDPNISQEDQELIERYLSNELSASELEIFSKRLEEEPLLQSRLTELKLISTGIRESVLSRRLDEFHRELEQEPRKQAPVLRFRTWMAAASVVVLLGILAVWMLGGSSNSRLYSEYFQPDPGLLTAMGGAEDYDFDRGMIDYKSGKYNEALHHWQALSRTRPANDTLNYFIGSALLASGKTDSAIVYFNRVHTEQESVFRSESFWYLGLSLLKKNKTVEAITAIERSGRKEKDELIRKLRKQ